MNIRTFIESVLDVVLPLKDRGARTKARSLADIPVSPTSHAMLGASITTLMEYRDPAVEDLIRALKYDGSSHAARLTAGVLADYLREELSASRVFSARRVLLVPVPLHKSRARERGWNQIELVLKALPKEFRDGTISTFAPHALSRTRATRPQTRLPRAERLSNVAGAFSLAEGAAGGTHVLLFDDVTTTGATLVNAANPLRRAGAEVTLIALARA